MVESTNHPRVGACTKLNFPFFFFSFPTEHIHDTHAQAAVKFLVILHLERMGVRQGAHVRIATSWEVFVQGLFAYLGEEEFSRSY